MGEPFFETALDDSPRSSDFSGRNATLYALFAEGTARDFQEFGGFFQGKDSHFFHSVLNGFPKLQGAWDTTLPTTAFCPSVRDAPERFLTAKAYRLASIARPTRAIL